MPTSPLVSVVIATYNRSRVLARAIDSVRRSTLQDWELIVVGDHCTDDTEQIVAERNDARIVYVNLPRNVGEQSGPNNEGVRLSRGRYIAFLNHDDLYFPDHLASVSRGVTRPTPISSGARCSSRCRYPRAISWRAGGASG
jgi:glycosyltransferase involved in cell wall biosynthesis